MTDTAEITKKPFLGPSEIGSQITLTPMPNGGWVVEQVGERGYMHKPLGAFGSASDMISALSDALVTQ